MRTLKPPSKTQSLYRKINTLAYLLGAPNFWHEKLNLPKIIIDIHDPMSIILNIIVWLVLLAEFGALFTQKKLNKKQRSDLIMFCFAKPILYSYAPFLARKKEKVRNVSYSLAVKLKEHYNDVNVENEMVKKIKIYMSLFSIFMFSAVISYGIDGMVQVIMKGSNFIALVTVWPDLEDTTKAANITRAILYILWFPLTASICSGYFVIIPLIVGLGHQYKNLKYYFCSLNDIFNMMISQREKERRYEKAIMLGINQHAETLRCAREMQKICNVVFSGQIIVNVTVVFFLLLQMVDAERTFSKTLVILMAIVAMMMSTGCLMWNAGDITIEASHLATAMFHSGWHNCRGQSAVRVRSLLVISMCHSQRPVEMRCLGVVKLSYKWFLKIVRASYSIFSVLY